MKSLTFDVLLSHQLSHQDANLNNYAHLYILYIL